MSKWINEKIAGYTLFIGLLLLAGFHLLVMFRVIPFSITWGGQLDNADQMIYFELASLVVTIYFAFVVALRLDMFSIKGLDRLVNVTLKIMFIYFLINFFANLLSTVAIEKLLFAPTSILFAIFAYRLIERKIFSEDSGNPFIQRN